MSTATTYTTKAGDTWDVVALNALGSERYATEMFDANPEHAWVLRFCAKVELVVPEVDTAVPSSLPPWMRS